MENICKGAQTARRFFYHELDSAWMGAVIITCFFTSGLIDSVAFNSWNCFVGMQTGESHPLLPSTSANITTGNTVFAALGIGRQPRASHSQQWYKSLVSIGSFCLGTVFFNAIHRWPTGLRNQPSSRRRWIFFISFVIQTLLVVIAALLVSLDEVSNIPFIAGKFSSGTAGQEFGPPNYLDLCPIAMLAFEAAGQVCLSRVLSVIELPTIVLSTIYHDFTADLFGTKEAWRKSSSFADFVLVQWKRQEKRFASIVALFIGALVGCEMYKSTAGMSGALWMAAGLKGAISLTFLIWKEDGVEEQTLPR